MPGKYVTVDAVATFVHHRGPTTLPGHPPDTSRGRVVLCLHDAGGNGGGFTPRSDIPVDTNDFAAAPAGGGGSSPSAPADDDIPF